MNKRKLRMSYRRYLFSYTFEAFDALRNKEAVELLENSK